MVAETVENSVATGTLDVLVRERHTEPASKHGYEERGFIVKSGSLGWRGVQPKASIASGDEFKVSAPCLVSGDWVGELAKNALLDGTRQLLLRPPV